MVKRETNIEKAKREVPQYTAKKQNKAHQEKKRWTYEDNKIQHPDTFTFTDAETVEAKTLAQAALTEYYDFSKYYIRYLGKPNWVSTFGGSYVTKKTMFIYLMSIYCHMIWWNLIMWNNDTISLGASVSFQSQMQVSEKLQTSRSGSGTCKIVAGLGITKSFPLLLFFVFYAAVALAPAARQ